MLGMNRLAMGYRKLRRFDNFITTQIYQKYPFLTTAQKRHCKVMSSCTYVTTFSLASLFQPSEPESVRRSTTRKGENQQRQLGKGKYLTNPHNWQPF